jgi:hypothetical protein
MAEKATQNEQVSINEHEFKKQIPHTGEEEDEVEITVDVDIENVHEIERNDIVLKSDLH